MRVIDRALRDLANPTQLATDRESARVFLAGSSMLSYWCELAGVDPGCPIARANELIAASAPQPFAKRW